MSRTAALVGGGLLTLTMLISVALAILTLLGITHLPCGFSRPLWLVFGALTVIYSGVRIYAFYIRDRGKIEMARLPPQTQRIRAILSGFYPAFAVLLLVAALRAC